MQNKKNVVVNKVRHSRMSLSGIFHACRCKTKENTLLDRYMEDPRYQSEVHPKSWTLHWITTRAFTLIELLVVVLIIGILAAVAVPQYQKAVQKARATEVINFVRPLMQSIDRYVLEHGFEDVTFFTTNPNKSYTDSHLLDIEIGSQLQAILQTFITDDLPTTAYCLRADEEFGDPAECHIYLRTNGPLTEVEFHKTDNELWRCGCYADTPDCQLYKQTWGCN